MVQTWIPLPNSSLFYLSQCSSPSNSGVKERCNLKCNHLVLLFLPLSKYDTFCYLPFQSAWPNDRNLTRFGLMCSTAGRLQGRRVADEEHGSSEWQCGYIAQHVQRQVCLRALEGRWVDGRRFGWRGLLSRLMKRLYFFGISLCFLSLFTVCFVYADLCLDPSQISLVSSHFILCAPPFFRLVMSRFTWSQR